MQKVVIVDDDRVNLLLAKKYLEKYYEVLTFTSPRDAFGYLQLSSPDLILLDVQMPDMNGFGFVQKIRGIRDLSQIPVIFLTGDRSERTEENCFKIGAADYIAKPFIPEIMIQRVRRCLELESYRKKLEQMAELQLYRINQIQTDIIFAMANLIESRDGTTGEHVKRTADYVAWLVKKLIKKGFYAGELDEEKRKIMYRAAPLHDIGKITIPDRILQKEGKLTFEEYEVMKTHSRAGAEIIKRSMTAVEEQDFVKIAYDMACYHHEKWDGTGYPCGLKQKEIPLSARILAVVDVFDALVSKRMYKETMTLDEAYNIMLPDRGKAYEPLIFDVLFENKDELEQFRLSL